MISQEIDKILEKWFKKYYWNEVYWKHDRSYARRELLNLIKVLLPTKKDIEKILDNENNYDKFRKTFMIKFPRDVPCNFETVKLNSGKASEAILAIIKAKIK